MKFERERTQPSKDLISKIADMSFSLILDLGCGPGNSTFAPKSKFTKSEIIGIDASKNMLLSWLGSIEQKPKVVFVNHGHDTVCDEFAKSIENELEISALAPYSGDGFELGDVVRQVDIGPRKLYDKKLHKVQRNNTVYDRLYLAGQNLMSVIEASKGCANKDLSRLTDQIIALCEKYKQD